MSLRSDVLHSMKWLAGARFVSQTIAWTVTIVVIRILSPADYGLMALAELMIGFAVLFRSMGLQTAIVQKRDLTARQISQTFGLLLALNCAIYILVFVAAPWIANLFDEPRLINLTRVLGIQFPVTAIAAVQGAILSRRMDFKRKSLAGLVGGVSNSIVTLTMALSGAGVWALVYGSLSGTIIRTIGLLVAARYWCWPRFSVSGMRSILSYGGFITANKMLWYVYSRSDVFIIGKILGTNVLGFYNIAMELATLPQRKTSAILNQVGFAAYSSIQDDLKVVRSHYLKVIRTVSFVAFPVFWGLSSVSPELVNVVLGQRWGHAIVPLQILSFVMPLRMIASRNGSPINAIGKPHLATIGQIFALLLMPPAFLIGAFYGGLPGASMAWLIGYPILMLIRLYIILPALGLGYTAYFRAMRDPALGAAIMYVVVIALNQLVAQPFLGPVAGLVGLIIAGVLTYTLFMWFGRQKNCQEFLGLIKQ